MSNNEVEDISALSALPELEMLELADNFVADLSPLAGLTRLTLLDLSGCEVSDISAFEHLPRLTKVVLNINHITDLSPLVNNADFGEGDLLFIRDICLDEHGTSPAFLDASQHMVCFLCITDIYDADIRAFTSKRDRDAGADTRCATRD